MEPPLDSKIDEILDALQHPNEYNLNEDILLRIQDDIDLMGNNISMKKYLYKLYLAQALLFYHRQDDENARKFAKTAIKAKGLRYPEAERLIHASDSPEINNNTNEFIPLCSPLIYIKYSIKNFANFSGRARRAEYWYWVLFWSIGYLILTILDLFISIMINSSGQSDEKSQTITIFSSFFALVTLLPYISVTVRRLHDAGYSGWYYFIGLIPIVGWIILIYFTLGLDDSLENRYGPNPLYKDIY